MGNKSKPNRKERRQLEQAAKGTGNTIGSSPKSTTKVDGGKDLAEFIKTKITLAPDKIKNDWGDDETEVVDIQKNPVGRKSLSVKPPRIEYSKYVGDPGTGTVTEVSNNYLKIKTVNPETKQPVTITSREIGGFKAGNIVSFLFDVHLGKLAGCRLSKIGDDTVLTSLSSLDVPVANIEFAANITPDQFKNIKAKSKDERFVVLA